MRVVVLLLLLIATPCVALAGDPASKLSARLQAEPARVVPGQVFDVVLVIRYDHKHFAQHAAPLFRQEMDVPLEVTLPWLENPVGARKIDVPSKERETLLTRSLVLNGTVVRGRLIRKTGSSTGPSVAEVALRRRFVATGTGPIKIPAPKLRYAHADKFEEDFLGERVPIEPRFIDVVGTELTIDVGAFPAGAPEGFAGAVGTGAVSTAIDRESVKVGETLRLTVRFSGADNLADLATPEPVGLEHFTVFGAQDDRAVPTRTVVYEIAPQRSDLREIPRIRFPVFHVQTGQFVEAVSKPIPLRVSGASRSADAADTDSDSGTDDEMPFWVNVLIGMVVGAAVVTLLNRRKRREDAAAIALAEAGPDTARVAAAAAALTAHPDERTLAEYLGAHMGCSPSSVVGPGLAKRLVAHGVSGDLARRTATAMEALTAARYGGGEATLDPALTSELQAELRSARTT